MKNLSTRYLCPWADSLLEFSIYDLDGSMSNSIPHTGHVYGTWGASGAWAGTDFVPLSRRFLSAGNANRREFFSFFFLIIIQNYTKNLYFLKKNDILQPILETMIDKGNVIYDRCSAGYELPTVVLGPSTSDDSDGCDLKTNGGTNPSAGLQQHNSSNMDHYGNGISVNQYGVEQPPPPSEPDDPFARFHPRLVQCVIKNRQRAKSVLLSRNNASTDGLGSYACDPLYYSAFAFFTSRGARICSDFLFFSIWISEWWVRGC